MRFTRSRGAIAVRSAALAVVTAVVIGCVPEEARATPSLSTPSSSPSPSRSASPSPTVSATLSPSAAAVPTPAAATLMAFATVNPEQGDAFVPAQTRGVGQLTGDWVFMLRRSTLFGTLPHTSGAEQVVATDRAIDTFTLVPLAGPETRAVTIATFLSNLGGGITATNLVGSQLSPDGRRVVLSAGTKGPQGGERLGLVIIDLASGNMFNLTTDSRYHD